MATLKKKFYLGVEGGGTKSTAMLVDEDDDIIMQRIGKALNYHSEGKESAKNNLASLLKPIVRKAKGSKLYAIFGLAGLDSKEDETFYKSIVHSVLPSNSVFQVFNDTKIALEAKCPNEDNRIVVISGTGSNVYGESGDTKTNSIGADFILGDEGSGYAIGLKALKASIRSWDGRTKKTLLKDLVLAQARCKTMEDLIPRVYKVFHEKTKGFKSYIASFAPLVDQAILRNDWAALEIRRESIEELAKGVQAVAYKLDIENKSFSIGLVGSVWNMSGLRENFQKAIQKQFPLASFSTRKEEGPWGAVLLAKKISIKRKALLLFSKA